MTPLLRDFPQFTKKIHSLSSTLVYKANCSLLNTTSIIFHRHSTLLHWTTLDTRHGIVRWPDERFFWRVIVAAHPLPLNIHNTVDYKGESCLVIVQFQPWISTILHNKSKCCPTNIFMCITKPCQSNSQTQSMNKNNPLEQKNIASGEEDPVFSLSTQL